MECPEERGADDVIKIGFLSILYMITPQEQKRSDWLCPVTTSRRRIERNTHLFFSTWKGTRGRSSPSQHQTNDRTAKRSLQCTRPWGLLPSRG